MAAALQLSSDTHDDDDDDDNDDISSIYKRVPGSVCEMTWYHICIKI
jgi:hypothetical protein